MQFAVVVQHDCFQFKIQAVGVEQCGLCVYGCTACSSATVCTTCGNGLKTVTGGGCACSSANTFYNV